MKLCVCILLFSVVFCSLCFAKKVRYDGYKVLRLTPKNEEQVKLIEKFKRVQGIMFWKGPSSRIGVESDIMVPPHLGQDLLKAVKDSGIHNEEYADDVQKLIESEGSSNVTKDTRLNWQQYPGLDSIYGFLEEQLALHPEDVTLETIGKSFEGRDIKVFKISKGLTQKPGIWIDSLIHAREWISGAVVTFMINEILNGQNTVIKSWANDFDFYFLPVVNPDGFVYSYTVDRIWRKTRSVRPDSLCLGVDANRNFGFKWQGGGSSSDPCSGTYAGPSAFSEPETKAISKYYDSIASNLVGFISLHSYGQLILMPYGIKGIPYPEYNNHFRIATKIQKAFARRQGTRFRAGSIVDILYTASGGSIDWVKATHNTNLTFVMELRDSGSHGFLLPSNQIVSSGQEFLDGFQVIVDELRQGVETSPKTNPVLKMRTPSWVGLHEIDSQSFGVLPSKTTMIIPGIRRY